MKTLVVYDSLYGNTKTIAQTIGDAIPGEVEVVHVGEAEASGLEAYDLLVVGAPTHGARPSPDAKVVALPRVGGLHHRYEWRDAA